MILKVDSLKKQYAGGVQALAGIDLTIEPGMFGLLGPNGAGKSTLMRILATLQLPDSGSVKLGEIDGLQQPEKVRQRLGYLPQEFGVYPGVSALDLLHHLAILKGFRQRAQRSEMVDYLLHKVNLYDQRKRAVSGYSGGMRQRFGIAQCLIGSPKLVIVDEPTAGLDPGERNRFYNILSEIGEQVVVLLSTHIVQDVRELCDRMAIMDKGQLLYSGTTQAALEMLKERVFERHATKDQLPKLHQQYQVLSSKLVGGRPLVHVYSESPLPEEFRPSEETLEHVYFAKLQRML
jgi:ABC-2 type transport system ATP-binding protein